MGVFKAIIKEVLKESEKEILFTHNKRFNK
jgi:hypothetical protein